MSSSGELGRDYINIKYDSRIDPPLYAYKSDAGLDLRNNGPSLTVSGGGSVIIHTGVHLNMGESKTFFGMVCIRSSFGKKGLLLANGVGIIDPGYQGEIMLCVRNINDQSAECDIKIERNERIGQLIFMSYHKPELRFVNHFEEKSDRGEGGFGSTGEF